MMASQSSTRFYGSGSLTVLFLHGWGNVASAWDDLITARVNLADLRCIAASYRGHGGSDEARSGYTHERFAHDMFAVADAVGAERFVMVGFSMAGKFGRYLAYLHSRRVLGQVQIAPAGPEKPHVPREAFIPWLEAATHPQRFREILLPFTRQP
jgi:pimeloyl-ACP methyl ester carboxylesterase